MHARTNSWSKNHSNKMFLLDQIISVPRMSRRRTTLVKTEKPKKSQEQGDFYFKNSAVKFSKDELDLIDLAKNENARKKRNEIKEPVQMPRLELAKELHISNQKLMQEEKEKPLKKVQVFEEENIIITPRDTEYVNINIDDNDNLFISQSQTSMERLPCAEKDKMIVPALKEQIREMAKEKSEKPMCVKLSDFVIDGKDNNAVRILSRGMKRIKKSCEYNSDNTKLPHLQYCVVDGIENTLTFEKLSMDVINNNPRMKKIIDDLYSKKYTEL